MQPPRHRKSQLLSISITLALVLIIANTVVRPPVNYGILFQSPADANNKSTTIIPIASNDGNYGGSSNRKVTEESSVANTSPSSFVVVQKSNVVRTVDNISASGNTSSTDNLTKSTIVLNTNRTYYRYTNTKNKNQIANLENNINSGNNNSNIGGILNKDINIALVAPTFTAAAYDHNSFYTFYNLYSNTSVGSKRKSCSTRNIFR